MTFTAPEMTYAAAEMTFTAPEMTYTIKMIIRNAGLWALRIRVNTMMMITVSCGLPQPDSLQPVLQMDARTSHEPQSGLTHAAEVIVAVSGQIVGLQVELISGLAPQQFGIDLGIRMIAVHAVLPAHIGQRGHARCGERAKP